MNLSRKAIRWFRDAYNLLEKNNKTVKRMKKVFMKESG